MIWLAFACKETDYDLRFSTNLKVDSSFTDFRCRICLATGTGDMFFSQICSATRQNLI